MSCHGHDINGDGSVLQCKHHWQPAEPGSILTTAHRAIRKLFDLQVKIPFGTKILHGIKFYGFTVAGGTVKLESLAFIIIFPLIVRCLC